MRKVSSEVGLQIPGPTRTVLDNKITMSWAKCIKGRAGRAEHINISTYFV